MITSTFTGLFMRVTSISPLLLCFLAGAISAQAPVANARCTSNVASPAGALADYYRALEGVGAVPIQVNDFRPSSAAFCLRAGLWTLPPARAKNVIAIADFSLETS